jgi:hypothetical protein
MWTGRWKSWYNPYDFAHQLLYALFGTSPLPLILAGIMGLLSMVTILAWPVAPLLTVIPLGLDGLCVLAAAYIVMARPHWADPPWLAERKRELSRHRRHPSSKI